MYQPLFWMPTFLLGMATYRLAAQWSLVPDQIATVISVTSLAALLVLAGLLSPPDRWGFPGKRRCGSINSVDRACILASTLPE